MIVSRQHHLHLYWSKVLSQTEDMMMRTRDRMAIGSQLARDCFTLLRQNTEWLRIPLLSSVGVIAVTVVFGILALIGFALFGGSTDSQNSSTTQTILGIVALFLYYFATYTIV